MIHIAIFSYLFVILTGLVCLTIALILYLKMRDRLLFHFLLYFSAFTIFVFFYLLVLTYINANFEQVDFYFMIAILAIIILSYSFLIYSILHFGHFLVNIKPSLKRKSFELLISIASFICIITSFNIDWTHNQIHQLSNFGLILSYALLLFTIIYIFILKLYYKKNVDPERKKILIRTSVMNIICVPGFLLDFYLLNTYKFALFIPFFYFTYSFLFLQYYIKKYYADLLTNKTLEDIQELTDFLNHTGVSEREKEIIFLIMKGHSNQKISDELFISLSTVKTHIRNIFQKLNVESRFEIISRTKKSLSN